MSHKSVPIITVITVLYHTDNNIIFKRNRQVYG